MRYRQTFDLSVYFVLDPSLCAEAGALSILEEALCGGVTMVQYRNKQGGPDMAEEARACLALCRAQGVPFLVNDDVTLAAEIGADGAHIGQGDMAPSEARTILGEGAILGLTAYTQAQIDAVDPAIIDYIGIGPFYATQTKKGKDILGPPQFGGNGTFGALAALSPVPVVGIGGIEPENAAAVIAAGADGVAVMRGIAQAQDPEAATRALVQSVAAARKDRAA